MLLTILLPSVLIPLILSLLACWLIQRYPILQSSWPLICLPSIVYLSRPSIPPAEAKDILWILLSLSLIFCFMFKSRLNILSRSQTLLATFMLIFVSWPALQHQFSLLLIIELLIVCLCSYYAFNSLEKIYETKATLLNSPIFSIAISSVGLGVSLSLGASLLFGQLALVLATILSVFTVIEYVNRSARPLILLSSIIPLMQIYFSIIIIARIYADLPMGIALLLLVAPLSSFVPRLRNSNLYSAVIVVCIVSWLIVTADSSSYY